MDLKKYALLCILHVPVCSFKAMYSTLMGTWRLAMYLPMIPLTSPYTELYLCQL